MPVIEDLKNILADTLNLGAQKNSLEVDSVLLGGLAELDSMAVVNVIAAIERRFAPGAALADDAQRGAYLAVGTAPGRPAGAGFRARRTLRDRQDRIMATGVQRRSIPEPVFQAAAGK